nr:uncharacterized protein LOC124491140 [Dermatophagoides farinae]
MMAKQNNIVREYSNHHHRRSFNQSTIKNLIIIIFCIVFNVILVVDATNRIKLCHQSPKLRFYDIVTHLDEQQQTSSSSSSSSLLLSSSSLNTSLPNPKYFRSLFHNTIDDDNDDDDATAADAAAAATDADDHDHVTVIALSSLHDERANTDAWINNLENIYHNLVEQKSFRNIRLILINSKDSYNPLWVNRIRKKVSFEVYQELSSSPIANQLDGHSGDVYIFDRCNLLAYYIRFPLSFIDRKDPFFQATILAAHTDSPCKEKCIRNSVSSSSTTNITGNQNETETIETTTTTMMMTTTDDSMTNITNQTDQATTTATESIEMNVLSQMGEILKIFYNRYTMNFVPESSESVMDNNTTSISNMTTKNVTTNLIDTLNRTIETYGLQQTLSSSSSSSIPAIQLDIGKEIAKNVTKVGNGELRSQLLPPNTRNVSKLSKVCQQTNCTEWTTERLLAARLCCLSITTEDDDEPMVNVNASVYIPSNGGFGCKLYPRTTCSMIKPILRCCTRKLVNQYFNYAIQLRERQRQQFRPGPGQRPVRDAEMILLKKSFISTMDVEKRNHHIPQ